MWSVLPWMAPLILGARGVLRGRRDRVMAEPGAAVQVQDKALDILAHHMQGNAAACIAHVPMIQAAARHNATSVRKRAVDILWDCYINAPAIAERNRGLVTRLLIAQLHMFDGPPPVLDCIPATAGTPSAALPHAVPHFCVLPCNTQASAD